MVYSILRILQHRGDVMSIICVANQKGGVAKTTTVANLAVGINRVKRDLKILVVDLDSQRNCTHMFLEGEPEVDASIVRLFETRVFKENPREIIHLTRFQNIHVLPAHSSLVDKGYVVGNLIKAHERVRMFLRELSYDVIIIDTPPSLGIFSLNGLVASDYVLATTVLEKFSVDGLEALFATVNSIQEAMGEGPEILGTLPVMVDMRLKAHNYYLNKLSASLSLNLLDKYAIGVNAPLSSATIKNETIFEYKPGAKSKYQYKDLARWVLRVVTNVEKAKEKV